MCRQPRQALRALECKRERTWKHRTHCCLQKFRFLALPFSFEFTYGQHSWYSGWKREREEEGGRSYLEGSRVELRLGIKSWWLVPILTFLLPQILKEKPDKRPVLGRGSLALGRPIGFSDFLPVSCGEKRPGLWEPEGSARTAPSWIVHFLTLKEDLSQVSSSQRKLAAQKPALYSPGWP